MYAAYRTLDHLRFPGEKSSGLIEAFAAAVTPGKSPFEFPGEKSSGLIEAWYTLDGGMIPCAVSGGEILRPH